MERLMSQWEAKSDSYDENGRRTWEFRNSSGYQFYAGRPSDIGAGSTLGLGTGNSYTLVPVEGEDDTYLFVRYIFDPQ
jgi:hypothetical protein